MLFKAEMIRALECRQEHSPSLSEKAKLGRRTPPQASGGQHETKGKTMNWKQVNRKAGWIVALVVILVFLDQQQQLNQSRRNEQAASRLAESWARELSDLKQKAALAYQPAAMESWAAPFVRPLSGKAGAR